MNQSILAIQQLVLCVFSLKQLHCNCKKTMSYEYTAGKFTSLVGPFR